MLLFVGVSHRSAPLALRERCAVPVDERAAALASLRRVATHAVLLSTCGRTEIYLDTSDPEAATTAARAWLARRAGMTEAALTPMIEVAEGDAAVCRAVRVACGLESAVQGEDEILGQVRRAWLDAAAAGSLSPALDRAFRQAVRAGRQVRRIGDPRAWTSLADLAAARVAGAVAVLDQPRVLVAGTGPMGRRVAASLRAEAGRRLDLTVAGRAPERAVAAARDFAARPALITNLPALLRDVDVAVVALRVARPLVQAADLPARSAERPLLVIDLSVPRAVELPDGPEPGMSLLNVDSLNPGARGWGRWDTADTARVEALVEKAVRETRTGGACSDTGATLAAWRMRADSIRRRQLEQTLRRLPGLDDEARRTIDALTRSIVNRILHEPTLRLRADQNGDAARQLQALFAET